MTPENSCPIDKRHLLVCQRVRFGRDEDRPGVVLVQVGAADPVEADLELDGARPRCRVRGRRRSRPCSVRSTQLLSCGQLYVTAATRRKSCKALQRSRVMQRGATLAWTAHRVCPGSHDADLGTHRHRDPAGTGRRLARRLRGRPGGPRHRPGGRRSSPPTASGATSSRSPGTSRPSRAATQIADMLARAAGRAPTRRDSAPARPAPQDGDVTSAFIEFETAGGRGVGHLRLKGDQAWTLLTALQELKGHEEPKGTTRVLGAVHGSDPDPRSWAEKRAEEEATLGRRDAAVRAGGRRRPGRHRARRAAAPARRARDRRRQARAARATSGASATSRCACTTRSGTTTCPTCRSRRTGRCSRRRTRSATGWSSTPG